MNEDPRPSRTILLGALIAVAPFAMDIYLPSMPSLAVALGAGDAAVNLTLSLYVLGWGIAQLFAGPLSDRFGRRSALLGGLAVFVVASLACALAVDIGMLIAARVAQAVGVAAVTVVPRAVVRDLHSGNRAAHMLSTMGMVLGIAPVVAPILGSELHVRLGWQSTFYFVAMYAAVLVGCVYFGLPETLRAPDRHALDPRSMVASYRTLLSSRRYVGYLAVVAATSSGIFAFLAGSANVLVTVSGAGERGFALLFGTVMLGNITGATIASRVVLRLGIDELIRRGTALMLAAGLAMAAFAWIGVRHPAAVVGPMFLFMVAFMATMPQATAGALTPWPKMAGRASSLLAFCQFLCAALSALVVGTAYDGTARPMATMIALMSAASFAAFRLLVLRSPRD